ncbi:MAG: hypothetical protein E7508_06015 [Ruminococcus sp.]|nr:hypothetical protein [Ruminococcus sp.]
MARSKELTVKRFVRTKRGIIPIEEITPEEREIWQKNVTDRLRVTFTNMLQNDSEFLNSLIENGAIEFT